MFLLNGGCRNVPIYNLVYTTYLFPLTFNALCPNFVFSQLTFDKRYEKTQIFSVFLNSELRWKFAQLYASQAILINRRPLWHCHPPNNRIVHPLTICEPASQNHPKKIALPNFVLWSNKGDLGQHGQFWWVFFVVAVGFFFLGGGSEREVLLCNHEVWSHKMYWE